MTETRKTISMSKHTIAELLHRMADMVEKDENIASELINAVQPSAKKSADVECFFDKSISDEIVREKLNKMEVTMLKLIVNRYTLDSKHVVRKWKEKDKIIEFILEKRKSLVSRYDGF